MTSKKSSKRSSLDSISSAELLSTKLEWKDLVLNQKTERLVNDIVIWFRHNKSFLKKWGMETRIKPGFRTLFYGPPGNGKTLTAALLGRQFGKDVYRIDLSMVVSKYIGETEKNLNKIFNAAEHSNSILFFDEADALFGKRSEVKDSHDRYANLEISCLLNKMDNFPGLIILSANNKNNIDGAFIRRFNSIIHFPKPDKSGRYLIWKSCISPRIELDQQTDLKMISENYELSGSAIINVIQYASLHALNKKSRELSKSDILEGINMELEKEGKVTGY